MDFQRPEGLGDSPILDVLEEAARIRHHQEEENRELRARVSDAEANAAADRKEDERHVKRLDAADKGLRGTQYLLASNELMRRYLEYEPYDDRRAEAEQYRDVSGVLGAVGGELIDQAHEIIKGWSE